MIFIRFRQVVTPPSLRNRETVLPGMGCKVRDVAAVIFSPDGVLGTVAAGFVVLGLLTLHSP
jgi:hypothetical protein